LINEILLKPIRPLFTVFPTSQFIRDPEPFPLTATVNLPSTLDVFKISFPRKFYGIIARTELPKYITIIRR